MISKDGSVPGIWYVSGGSELTMQQVAVDSPRELGRGCVRLSNVAADGAASGQRALDWIIGAGG